MISYEYSIELASCHLLIVLSLGLPHLTPNSLVLQFLLLLRLAEIGGKEREAEKYTEI